MLIIFKCHLAKKDQQTFTLKLQHLMATWKFEEKSLNIKWAENSTPSDIQKAIKRKMLAGKAFSTQKGFFFHFHSRLQRSVALLCEEYWSHQSLWLFIGIVVQNISCNFLRHFKKFFMFWDLLNSQQSHDSDGKQLPLHSFSERVVENSWHD